MENNFDPNAAAVADSGIYGLPCTAEEAQIIIIPVEWELTTSYNRGTVDGPATIMEASLQVDLCHHDYPDLWQKGIWMDEFPKELRAMHDEMAPLSEDIINALYEGTIDDEPENMLSYMPASKPPPRRITPGCANASPIGRHKVRLWAF